MNQPVQKLLTEEELFCLEGCRSYSQYHRMRSGFESGHCRFCVLDRTLNKVCFENSHWLVSENPFSRSTLEVQLLIISRVHVRFLYELPAEAWADFSTVIEWIEGADSRYATEKGGMLFVRFGDMRYNAGSVPHLHWNYWIPNGTGEEKIPIMKEGEGRASNQVRAGEFSARYEAGEQP